jgi:hypothetical protein
MKKLPIVMLALLTLPVHAQSILNTLNQHQSNLKPATSTNGQTSSTTSESKPDVKPSGESVSSTSTKCEENDQTSLPLAYVNSLLLEKDGALNISHDPSGGTLEIKAPSMISNCNSMIEWKLKKPEILGKKAYAVEAVIKRGDVCNVDGTCSYKVKLADNGDFKEHQNMNFKPTLKGFEECLQKSGVIANGKVVPAAIASEQLLEKFSGLDYSGKLLFLSHGPSSPLVKAKYGKFEFQNGCDYYENTAAQPTSLMTATDANKERLDAEASKLRECKADEYYKLSEFISKYDEYASDLSQVRDRLIIESVKKSAENITKGKYTAEDMKVIKDFQTYIVEPKIKQATDLYELSLDQEGEAKLATQAELTKVLAEISALQKAPYFNAANVNKLIKDGKFDEATTMNNFITILYNHQRLGTIENGTKITSGVAAQRSNIAIAQFKEALKKEVLIYEHKTGQKDTEQAKYVAEAAGARWRIQERNANYTARIQEVYADITPPNGHCFKYFVNSQKCQAETQQDLTDLVNKLQFDNNFDLQIATRADANAKEWGAYSAEGRRYIATQNGEEVPAETAATTQPQDNTVPPTRQTQPTAPNFYNFQQPGQQQGQQAQGQQQQYFNYQGAMQSYQQYQQQTVPYQGQQSMNQQSNPYAQYMGGQQQQQYNPFMGQQAYGYQPQYGQQYGQQYGGQFNMNFGMGQQQNPYSMYGSAGGYQQQSTANSWYRPYGTAYNQYSLYGR